MPPAPATSSLPLAVEAASPASDRRFEPGKRFGAVTGATDEAALKALYGAENVVRRDWAGAEGELTPATVVFADTPAEFWVLWRDNAFAAPERILIVGTHWQSGEGLNVGDGLAELHAINAAPFEFSGFDWDYGGVVSSWGEGRLAAHGDGTLFVQLETRAPNAATENFLGDQTYRSDAPGADRLEMKIVRIDISL